MTSTRIIKEINYFEFRILIDKHGIKVNSHAYFRLNQEQRKVYKDDVLIEILTEEKPSFVGLQHNGNYTAFFSRKFGYLRLIFKVTNQYVEVITFYITDHIPKI